jgi:hypothetical protein
MVSVQPLCREFLLLMLLMLLLLLPVHVRVCAQLPMAGRMRQHWHAIQVMGFIVLTCERVEGVLWLILRELQV